MRKSCHNFQARQELPRHFGAILPENRNQNENEPSGLAQDVQIVSVSLDLRGEGRQIVQALLDGLAAVVRHVGERLLSLRDQ